jgi:hypothetical protein
MVFKHVALSRLIFRRNLLTLHYLKVANRLQILLSIGINHWFIPLLLKLSFPYYKHIPNVKISRTFIFFLLMQILHRKLVLHQMSLCSWYFRTLRRFMVYDNWLQRCQVFRFHATYVRWKLYLEGGSSFTFNFENVVGTLPVEC